MRRGLVVFLCASWLPATLADYLEDLHQPWQGTLEPIAELRLAELPKAIAEQIAETRRRLNELLVTGEPQEMDIDVAATYGRLGGLYAAGNLNAAALTAFENARNLDPDSFRWTYYAGYMAQQTGALERAIDLFDRAHQINPNYQPLALRRAEALRGLDRLMAVKEAYAVVSDPALQAARLYGEAQVHILEREWSSAASKLTAVLELQPQADAARYSLGQVLLRLGKRAEARTYLAQHGERKPEYPDDLVDELRALQQGAVFEFERAMQAVNRDDSDAAVGHFAAGLRQDPGNVRARTSYARALWMAGDRQNAIIEMRRAAEQGPKQSLAYFLLAVLEEEEGNRKTAETGYRAVLELDPEHPGGLSYLGRLLLRQGRYAEAVEVFDRAVAAGAKAMPVYLHYWAALRGAQVSEVKLLRHLQDFDLRFPEPPVFRYLEAKLLATSTESAVQDRPGALVLAQQLLAASPMPEHAELLALTAAVNGEFERAAQLLLQPLQLAHQRGAMQETARLEALHQRYRGAVLPEPIWPMDDPMLVPLPVSAEVAWRNYPATHPY